ncbi:hypothetical protein [Halopseudomonas laoshanensis]|uniref:hypothetical protein n=1 Tax=Halopseudomonas laoshanensis TaxID=2268758 RepID=UPI003736809F
MSSQILNATRAAFLADWQEAIEDKNALLNDSETYTAELIGQANRANDEGLINAEDLREMREWADAAQSWAIEELVDRTKE